MSQLFVLSVFVIRLRSAVWLEVSLLVKSLCCGIAESCKFGQTNEMTERTAHRRSIMQADSISHKLLWNGRLEKTPFAWRRHWASGPITHFQVTAVKVLFRACERSGAAKFPAHRSAPFTGVPLTALFPLRRPPAPAPLDFLIPTHRSATLIWLLTRSAPAPQQGRI